MKMTRVGLTQFNAAATDVSEALFGETITIQALEVLAAVSHPTQGGELGLGVETLEAILKVRVRKSLIPAKPVHGEDTLIFNGDEWRIDEVTDDRASAVWYLSCVPAKK